VVMNSGKMEVPKRSTHMIKIPEWMEVGPFACCTCSFRVKVEELGFRVYAWGSGFG